jgi:putative ABC transport system permease protein
MGDLTNAIRALRQRPGLAAVAIVTLALGIGAAVAIFSVVDAVLLRPLPYHDPDRLVVVWGFSAEVQQRTGLDRLPWSPGDTDDFISRNRTFATMAWVRVDRVNLSGTDDPERIGAVRVSRAFFDTFGVPASHGRTFVDSDGQGGRVVVISDRLWTRRFARDPQILTRPITLNGQPATVVGVLPQWFRFPAVGDLSQGLGYTLDPEVWTLDVLAPDVRRRRDGKSFSIVGRLRPDASDEAAGADLAAIAADIAQQFPASNAGWTTVLVPLREQLVGSLRPALMVLLAAVGALLLVACANVANLLLAGAAARQRDFCVRQALGASRGRLLRALLVESVLLGAAAGVLGILVAWASLRVMLSVLPAEIPALAAAGLDPRGIAFTALVALGAALLFGIVPALYATRLDVGDGLRDTTRGAVGTRRAHRTRSVLVMVEVATAVVILVAAVLLAQTFARLVRVDPGFRPARVLTAEVSLPRAQYAGEKAAAFFEDLMARLSAIPGVDAAAVASTIPLAGPENLRQVTIEGQQRPNPGEEIISDYRVVSPDYFRAMGISLLDGSLLPRSLAPDAAPTLVINRTMAETCFRGVDPVGRRMKLTSFEQSGPWFTITGVVNDTRHTGLDVPLRPQVYVHHRGDPSPQMSLVIKTSTDPDGYAPLVRSAVTAIDRNQPVARIRSMDAILGQSIARQRFTMYLLAMFAGLTLILALAGLYAVVSHSVEERIREMGVRVALGASPSRLMRLVLTESLRLAAAGIVVGIAIALCATQFMKTLLFGVQASDPLTFVLVPLLLLATSTAGCLVPAARAMRVDPIVALRVD